MAKLTFRQGVVRHQGGLGPAQGFLSLVGDDVNLIVSPDFTVITFVHGTTNYLYTESVSITSAWGPFVPPTDYWLYWDLNLSTGVVTRGSTTLEPIESPSQPGSPATGQMWFNTVTNLWFAFTGSSFTEVVRVFACKLTAGTTFTSVSASTPDFRGTQVGLTTTQKVGSLVFGSAGNPLRKGTGNQFFTTEDDFLTGVPTGASLRIESITVTGQATEVIPAYYVVQYDDFDMIGLADPFQQGLKLFGIVEGDVTTGEVTNFVIQGSITNEAWDWEAAGALANAALFVGPTGELVLLPSIPNQLPVATVIGKQEILFAPALFPQVSLALEEINVEVQDEGTSLTSNVAKINFAGTGVSTTLPLADEVLVTIPGLIVEEEGVSKSNATIKLNFVGTGVEVTEIVTDELQISIPDPVITFGEYVGTFDASSGSFPVATNQGDWFNVTVAGTVDSQSFVIGDILVALIDAPSTTTFAGNWSIVPNISVDDHTLLTNIGTNTHTQIDTHIADATLHFTQASISITESQISDLQSYLLEVADADGDTQIQVEETADEDIIRFDTGDNVTGFPAQANTLVLSSAEFTLALPTADVAATAGAAINITAGTGNTEGAGGAVNITAGNTGTSSNQTQDGGKITLQAGYARTTGGAGDVVGVGGGIDIIAGDMVRSGSGYGKGGDIAITAGESYHSGNGPGAGITLTAGRNRRESGSISGGDINLIGGYGDSDNDSSSSGGGDVKLTGGEGRATGDGNGGDVRLLGGVGGNDGGDITLTGGQGYGTDNPATKGDGGNIKLTGGLGQLIGGNIVITPGVGGANGAGAINIVQSTAPLVTTDKLYNEGGALTWNGIDLTAGGGGGDSIVDADGDTSITTELNADEDLIRFNTGAGLTGYPLNTNTLIVSSREFQLELPDAYGGNYGGPQITLRSGEGSGSGAGGRIRLIVANSGAIGSGGEIVLQAGFCFANTEIGGHINVYAGGADLGTGGAISIKAGYSDMGTAGDVNINSGYNQDTGDAGNINITGGYGGSTSGDGGDIVLQAGTASTGSTGSIVIPTQTAPDVTTNKLYNEDGTLTWNGIDLTAPQLTFNTQVGTSYTAVLSDAGIMITLDNGSAIAMTIPANASVPYPIGTQINFQQLGAGAVTIGITADTLNVNANFTKVLNGAFAIATAVKMTATTWTLFGNLVAV